MTGFVDRRRAEGDRELLFQAHRLKHQTFGAGEVSLLLSQLGASFQQEYFRPDAVTWIGSAALRLDVGNLVTGGLEFGQGHARRIVMSLHDLTHGPCECEIKPRTRTRGLRQGPAGD